MLILKGNFSFQIAKSRLSDSALSLRGLNGIQSKTNAAKNVFLMFALAYIRRICLVTLIG